MRGWRNWQTHYLEVVAPARVCRFNSCPAHKYKKSLRRFFVLSGIGVERERGRGNGSFPVAEHTNRWVRKSERVPRALFNYLPAH